MLRQRLLAAGLGLPTLFVFLGLNWLLRARGNPDDLPLLALIVMITAICGWEISNVVRHRYPKTSPWNGVYAALLVPFLVHSVTLAGLDEQLGVGTRSLGLLIDSLGATAAAMALFLGVWTDAEHRGWEGLRENLYVILASLYVGITMSTLFLLQMTPYHELAVLFLFLAVFALDTAAYFGGKLFGGPRLAPRVSPKKTISGALAGLLGTVLFSLLFILVPLKDLPRPSWVELLAIAVCIGVLGQLGDLLESAFKRWGGVKDAGSVLPGHGGFLDRFDSLFLAAPVYYLLLYAFLKTVQG